MTNNDILRSLRYIFDFNDSKMIEIFALANREISRTQISQGLKRDEDPDFQTIHDGGLSNFLDGFIIFKRGKKEGAAPITENEMSNNAILRKLKIALSLKDDEMLEILAKVDMIISKHELSAFFRNPTQSQYRVCNNQILRNFIHGMQIRYKKDG